jgi:hypothetical protein
MTRIQVKPKWTPPPEEWADHPDGVCMCSKKQRHIVRTYQGYGKCGFCGKLVGWRRVRVAKDD